MGKYSTHKLISMIIFVAMMFLFFIWLTNQIQDFAYFFGFRMSDVVANDIASLMTTLGGIPGTVTYNYEKTGRDDKLSYDAVQKNNMICVVTKWGDTAKSCSEKGIICTSDCAALPSYDTTDLPPDLSSIKTYAEKLTKDYVTGSGKVSISAGG